MTIPTPRLRELCHWDVWKVGRILVVVEAGSIVHVDTDIDVDVRLQNIGRNKKRWGK